LVVAFVLIGLLVDWFVGLLVDWFIGLLTNKQVNQ
jgi:hypothetical protein